MLKPFDPIDPWGITSIEFQLRPRLLKRRGSQIEYLTRTRQIWQVQSLCTKWARKDLDRSPISKNSGNSLTDWQGDIGSGSRDSQPKRLHSAHGSKEKDTVLVRRESRRRVTVGEASITWPVLGRATTADGYHQNHDRRCTPPPLPLCPDPPTLHSAAIHGPTTRPLEPIPPTARIRHTFTPPAAPHSHLLFLNVHAPQNGACQRPQHVVQPPGVPDYPHRCRLSLVVCDEFAGG